MKRSNLTLLLYLSMVFASGLLVGSLGYRLYNAETTAKAVVTEDKRPGPAEWRARYVSAMTKRLQLSDEQLVQLNAILDESKVKYDALEKEAHDSYRPQRRKVREDQIAKTIMILTPEQQVEYEKLREERAEKRRKHHERERQKKEAGSSKGLPAPPAKR